MGSIKSHLLDTYCQGINEEIRGFSHVIGVLPEQVLFYAMTYLERGCSLMAVLPEKSQSGHTLMARNYDFNNEMEEMCFAYTNIKGKYSYIGSTLNLFGRCDGMNEHGLAVCKASNGLPVGNFEGGQKAGITGFSFWVVIRRNEIDTLIGNRLPAQILDNTLCIFTDLTPQIVTVPEIYIMGIHFKTTISGNESGSMWQLFNPQIPNEFKNYERYGIFETIEDCSSDAFNSQSETTALVGIEYPKEQPILNGMQRKKLLGGKYAKFIHTGKVEHLIQTYHYILGGGFLKVDLSWINVMILNVILRGS